MLGTEALEGGISIHEHVNGRLVEENVVECSMAIRLGYLEGSVSGLNGGAWCTRVFAVELQGCGGIESIKR